jgi:hypothetical protein
MTLAGFKDVGTAGGTLKFDVGSSYTNIITGILTRSGNGVAVACLIDIGLGGALAHAGPGGPPQYDGTPRTTISLVNRGNSTQPSATCITTNQWLLIAGVGAIGTNALAGSAVGWSDLVADAQPSTLDEAGGEGATWAASRVVLSVYNGGIQPINPNATWAISGGAENWAASAGLEWIPGLPSSGGAASAQVIG